METKSTSQDKGKNISLEEGGEDKSQTSMTSTGKKIMGVGCGCMALVFGAIVLGLVAIFIYAVATTDLSETKTTTGETKTTPEQVEEASNDGQVANETEPTNTEEDTKDGYSEEQRKAIYLETIYLSDEAWARTEEKYPDGEAPIEAAAYKAYLDAQTEMMDRESVKIEQQMMEAYSLTEDEYMAIIAEGATKGWK